MQKTCVQCSAPFDVTDEQLAFLKKAAPVIGKRSFELPPPSRCPDCRQQRRMTFRNERSFHHRTCSGCKKAIIAVYADSTPFPVYCQSCWQNDTWDPLSYGADAKTDESFLKQFKALQDRVPRQYFVNLNSENSDYCNQVEAVKNCYLVTGTIYAQNCLYGTRVLHCNDCVDCLWTQHCELCYECIGCNQCYNVHYGQNCVNVRDSRHVIRCQHGADLLFCVNLRQKSHCILNEQLTPAEFKKRRDEILASQALLQEHIAAFQKLTLSCPAPCLISQMSDACTGNYVFESSRVKYGFDVTKGEDSRFIVDAVNLKDCMDVFSFYGPGELCYDIYSAGLGAFRSLFIRDCWPCTEILYCDYCFGCEHCFGCIGLRHKKYCILNKQVTKEEYEAIVPRLIERMRTDGEWGEYFPVADSPFPYNESAAQDVFPLTKGEVLRRGWPWAEPDEKHSAADRIIGAADVPTDIADVTDDIVQVAIRCEATGRLFKIIKQEVEFYRNMKIPVPRIHPDERHRRRMILRNPWKLWSRSCAKCSKGMETSYAPERPEIVYCERCYLETVY